MRVGRRILDTICPGVITLFLILHIKAYGASFRVQGNPSRTQSSHCMVDGAMLVLYGFYRTSSIVYEGTYAKQTHGEHDAAVELFRCCLSAWSDQEWTRNSRVSQVPRCSAPSAIELKTPHLTGHDQMVPCKLAVSESQCLGPFHSRRHICVGP